MYKITGIICPYCGFKDVRKVTGEYWCCDCNARYIISWIDGVMKYVRKARSVR